MKKGGKAKAPKPNRLTAPPQRGTRDWYGHQQEVLIRILAALARYDDVELKFLPYGLTLKVDCGVLLGLINGRGVA